LRQAYDYWQNQPGNYLKPKSQNSKADPPKGASLYQAGSAEAPKAATLPKLRALVACAADSIAPTEFPKSWSATRHGWRCRQNPFPLHTALRRRKPTPRHAGSGYATGLSPKIWWIFGKASNPQTPKGAHQKTDGASIPATSTVAKWDSATHTRRMELPRPWACS